MNHPRSTQQGFMLIEVIVAFALLALALTFLLGSLSSSARQIRVADQSGRATLHAQSLLAQVGVGEPLETGRREGSLEAGRYRWTLDITPYADPARPPSIAIDPVAPRLLELHLHMQWGEDAAQRLHWQTLRLVPADINQPTAPP